MTTGMYAGMTEAQMRRKVAWNRFKWKVKYYLSFRWAKNYYKESLRMKDRQHTVYSESGDYVLVFDYYNTGWGHSRLRVYSDKYNYTKSDKYLIADIKNNYCSIPHEIIEGHPDGHDYLISTPGYMNLIVVQLDTGKVKKYIPKEAASGHGFCHVEFKPSPNKLLLCASGCIWAAPYELRVYDFSNPMDMPWKELAWCWYETAYEWKDDETILHHNDVDVRKSDGKRLFDLTEEELNALADDDSDCEVKRTTVEWKPLAPVAE